MYHCTIRTDIALQLGIDNHEVESIEFQTS
jgi:hypothetical protein